ncbi:hypothetical protein BAG01nite_08200 [Brevibacillus agri]|uniref:AraC family transcriptional regulator n=1 Tax=Brevibacillus agri TaxID=51101 RepID=A0ABQ0SM58_9BACL|nr:hypothetical protein BAG01nite_08200 [Brevibacillus agri]
MIVGHHFKVAVHQVAQGAGIGNVELFRLFMRTFYIDGNHVPSLLCPFIITESEKMRETDVNASVGYAMG